MNALEHLIAADYQSDALAEQLEHLGYDASDMSASLTELVYAESRRLVTEKALRKLLVREALNYGLPSAETSFIAVRHDAGKRVDTSVVVANALPSGWARGGGANSVAFGAGPAQQAPMSSALPGMGQATMPTPAGMPMPSTASGSMASGPGGAASSGSKPDQWTTIFSGAIAVAGKERTLYDSASSPIQPPTSMTINGIRVMLGDGVDRTVRLSQSILIRVHVGDTVEPRAKMKLADLIRFGERPLNLRRVNDERILITLDDSDGELAGRTDLMRLDVQW